MALHAAAMMAFFMDQTQQAQCVPAVPDSPWKWIIQSVIPVAGGTLIAVWSFAQNRNSEQKQWERNQKASHEQWIRDQKKAEWRELLDVVNECQLDILIANVPIDQTPERSKKDLMAAKMKLMKTNRVLDDRVFIDRSVLGPLSSRWHIAIKKTEYAAKSSDPYVSSVECYIAFKKLIKAIRVAAKKDIGIEDEQESTLEQAEES